MILKMVWDINNVKRISNPREIVYETNNGNDIYSCAHFSRKKKSMLKILLQFVEVQLLLVFNACKHYSLLIFFFFLQEIFVQRSHEQSSN